MPDILKTEGNQKIDIFLWAHSDQAGGTEIPCVMAKAFRSRTGFGVTIGIITPFPRTVDDFFQVEGGHLSGIEKIQSPALLSLGKNPKTSSVDPSKTMGLIESRFSSQDPKKLVYEFTRVLKPKCKSNSLMISCGEPIALEVAKRCGIMAIIVTDHLLTQSVRRVIDRLGGVPNYISGVLKKLEFYEISPTRGAIAFLSPPEFGVPEYREYLEKNWEELIEINGLFYDPVPIHELYCAPHYIELNELNKQCPVVIVFGGGGEVWDQIYVQLHKAVKGGGLGKSDDENQFSLILRDVNLKGKVVPRTWKLFKPGNKKGKSLNDPGKMMYWYAACSLLVGRGGLAAQQIFATMQSNLDNPPGMLFIEEPGHAQIESERRSLRKKGLVIDEDLDSFKNDPFGKIKNTLSKKNLFREISEKARLRYSPGTIERLADFILNRYKPHRKL